MLIFPVTSSYCDPYEFSTLLLRLQMRASSSLGLPPYPAVQKP